MKTCSLLKGTDYSAGHDSVSQPLCIRLETAGFHFVIRTAEARRFDVHSEANINRSQGGIQQKYFG